MLLFCCHCSLFVGPRKEKTDTIDQGVAIASKNLVCSADPSFSRCPMIGLDSHRLMGFTSRARIFGNPSKTTNRFHFSKAFCVFIVAAFGLHRQVRGSKAKTAEIEPGAKLKLIVTVFLQMRVASKHSGRH